MKKRHILILLWEIIWEESISLIPQSLKNWGTPISLETMFGTQRQTRGGGGGRWMKQKHKEKQRGEREREKHIRRQILKLPRANPAYYISHLIMWRGLFWRWLFVRRCDWNNNDGGLVFLLHLQREQAHKNLFLHCLWHQHRWGLTWRRPQTALWSTFVLTLFSSSGILLSCNVTVSGECHSLTAGQVWECYKHVD